MLLAATLLLILALLFAGIASPRTFVVASLWIMSLPYWWNFNLQTIFSTPVGQLNIVAMQVFGLCLAGLAAAAASGGLGRSTSATYVAHLSFLLFCLASLAWAPSLPFGLRMVAKLAAPFLFLLVVDAVASADETVESIRKAVIGNGVVLLALAVLARILGIQSDPNAVVTGESGLGPPGMGPPVFAAHMLPVAMLLCAQLITRRNHWDVLLLVASIAAILATRERTAAAALYLGAAAILAVGTRGLARVVLPAAGIFGLPLLFVLNDDFRRRMFYGDASASALLADPAAALSKVNGSGRFALWDEVLQLFYSPHPLQGSGMGATQEFLYARHNNVGVVHSEYVRLLCEVGLIGLALFVAAAVSYLVCMVFSKPTAREPARVWQLAAVGSVVSYLVFISTDNGFDYVSQFGIYVFAVVGVARALGRGRTGVSIRDAMTAPTAAPRAPLPNLMR